MCSVLVYLRGIPGGAARSKRVSGVARRAEDKMLLAFRPMAAVRPAGQPLGRKSSSVDHLSDLWRFTLLDEREAQRRHCLQPSSYSERQALACSMMASESGAAVLTAK